MDYQVLARKWRPRIFEDIIGQEHITRTLQNAISSKRVGHAYLFTGLRGIGKTSAARVFAKAMRCENRQNANPCNKCSSCEEITSGISTDVLEIDGASNRGVDDSRAIRSATSYLPSSGKMRIFIIDEVHMLTKEAFAALLKTLEEPPPHVLFIFATTESQKIPPTILSRCQCFNFKRASNTEIVGRLEYIAKSENITLERSALQLISRESEGSVRDALSLLDQVIAFSVQIKEDGSFENQLITIEQAAKALGIVDRSLVLKTLKAIVERNPIEAVKQVEAVYQFGFDLKQFSGEIYEALRALTLVKISGDQVKEFLELPENEIEEMSKHAKLVTTETLQILFKTFHENISLTLRGLNPRVSLEMLLIRLATLEPVESIQNLLAAVNINGESRKSPLVRTEEKKTHFSVKPPSNLEKKVEKTWQGFIGWMKKNHPGIAFALEAGNLTKEIDSNAPKILLEIAFPETEAFSRDTIFNKQNELRKSARDFFSPKEIEIKLIEPEEVKKLKDFKSIAELDEIKRLKALEKSKNDLINHPVIQGAKKIFDGEIKNVQFNNREDVLL